MPETFFSATLAEPSVGQTRFDPHVEEILSLVGDGVVSIDEEGRIILFNRAAEQLFGYASAELLGCPIEVLIPMRFHDLHRKDVAGFASSAVAPCRAMGRGREVLGRHKNASEFPIEATLSSHVFAGQRIFMAVVRDVTDQTTAEQQRQLIVGEVAHRLRNTMSVVNSIISSTARRATSLPEFITSLLGRLRALSRTNDALIGGAASELNLHSLLHSELTAFQHDDVRFTLAGPHVQIEGRLALNLGLIFHELATNAAKYGAFSAPGGKIYVEWHVDDGKLPTLKLSWQETGGPTVEMPSRTGFGTQLIGNILNIFGGKTEIIYVPGGIFCLISVPLENP